MRDEFARIGERVRARAENGRWEVVSGEGSIEEVESRVWALVSEARRNVRDEVGRLWQD